MSTDKTNKLEEACKAAFGAWPADVLIVLDTASEKFLQLEEIFKTIAEEADRNSRLKRLADAGAHIAADMGNYVDVQHADYRDNLHKAGIVTAPEAA